MRKRFSPLVAGSRLPCLLLFLLLGSCAAPAGKSSAVPGPQQETDVIYRDVEAVVAQYREGLHRMRQDDDREAGRVMMDSA
ncbi:MAG: hypothetical protein ACKPE6_15240, partial [Gammaproteobacteria bacterium]